MGGGHCEDEIGSEAAAAAGRLTINVSCTNGSKLAVETTVGSTVGELKEAIARSCDVPAVQQRLIYKGRFLKDDQTLASYGLESDHTIHMVRGAAPPVSGNVPVSSSVPVSQSSTQGGPGTTGSTGSGGIEDSTFGGLPFPGFGAFGSNSSPGLFGFADFGQIQRQLIENPNMMSGIMNMPIVQNIMNNPDVIRNFFMSNPQMREVLDRNPEIAHILNDPNILQQTMETARNPELMREMMRNTDRAMSNIESSPEGFNMLRRMYETVQEPLLNATAAAGAHGNGLGFNPLAAFFGNRGATNGQDRSLSSSTTVSEAAGSPAPNSTPLPNPWGDATSGNDQANNMRPSPSPVTDVRMPGIAGTGGNNLPDLERIFSGSEDTSPFVELLQNPAMMQIMQNLFSNPQYMNQFLNHNSGDQNILESNTQIREMLQNSEFLQRLTSPETLQLFQPFQQLLSSLGRPLAGQDQNRTASSTGTGTPNTDLEFLMGMLGGVQGGDGMGVRSPSNVPLEDLYATQLSQLQEMGFFDTQENIRALGATAGNVHAAVDRLLGNLGRQT